MDLPKLILSNQKEESITCASPGIFVRGVQVRGLFVFFFVFFFSPQLILQKSNGQFQRNLSFFQGSRGGPKFSRGGGGVQLFPGGVQLLIPY